MREITCMMRISDLKIVCEAKAWLWAHIQIFSLKFSEKASISAIHTFRENVLENSWNVSDTLPWLLASPGHQQPWHWLCKIGILLSCLLVIWFHVRITVISSEISLCFWCILIDLCRTKLTFHDLNTMCFTGIHQNRWKVPSTGDVREWRKNGIMPFCGDMK